MKAWPLLETEAANTPIWQFVILPAEPVYCRPTPQEALPCLRKPVSSITSTASGAASVSTTSSRTTSRKASASQWLRPKIACCRQGPGSPAVSARIQPVLRRSAPSSPSRTALAEAATLGAANSERMRRLACRSVADQSVADQSSRVVSSEAAGIEPSHPKRIREDPHPATVMLEKLDPH